LWKAIISFVMSVRLLAPLFICTEQLGSTGQIFMKSDFSSFWKSVKKIQVWSLCSSAWNNSAPLDRFSWNLSSVFSEKLSRKSKFHDNLTRITGMSYEECIFIIISHSILLRMRNVSDRICRENQNKFCVWQLFSENFAVYVEKYCRARQATDDIMVHVHCMLDN